MLWPAALITFRVICSGRDMACVVDLEVVGLREASCLKLQAGVVGTSPRPRQGAKSTRLIVTWEAFKTGSIREHLILQHLTYVWHHIQPYTWSIHQTSLWQVSTQRGGRLASAARFDMEPLC